MEWYYILAGLALVLGPLLGYLAIVRRLSGKISTTEASQLWQEADRMRQEYREEIARLQAVVDRYESRLVQVEQRNKTLVGENLNLTTKIGEHENTIAELRVEITRLSIENQKVRADSDRLRARVMELENMNGRT